MKHILFLFIIFSFNLFSQDNLTSKVLGAKNKRTGKVYAVSGQGLSEVEISDGLYQCQGHISVLNDSTILVDRLKVDIRKVSSVRSLNSRTKITGSFLISLGITAVIGAVLVKPLYNYILNNQIVGKNTAAARAIVFLSGTASILTGAAIINGGKAVYRTKRYDFQIFSI